MNEGKPNGEVGGGGGREREKKKDFEEREAKRGVNLCWG